ncbi:hypothetical protein PE067_05080 [Paracoccus sp. DMF-8]|uniref:hypothetical protein n=1 Tax=Paracoccus sp. DMF-8 TaxID=3019445 RepID=UPI0023E8B1B3|nr:hypothetical protein [Paracoccus sp. DMF-8]MDF3605573.1 hypothetical protein [Paracoccus sp. DMF-8]
MPGWPRRDCRDSPRACLTVTFDSPRLGHVLEIGPQICAQLVVADIGLGPRRGTAFDAPPAELAGPGFCRHAGGGLTIWPAPCWTRRPARINSIMAMCW